MEKKDCYTSQQYPNHGAMKPRFISLSPPDSSHVSTSMFLVESLAKKYEVRYYGFLEHKNIIEKSGAIFVRYPKKIEEKILLASPYNLPIGTSEKYKNKLISSWEVQKTELADSLISWLLDVSGQYEAIIMDVAFYQRAGFAVPYVTRRLQIPFIGSFPYFPSKISFNLRLTPENIGDTISNPIFFHTECSDILNKYNVNLADICSYVRNETTEIYYSSGYKIGGEVEDIAFLIGNRKLDDNLNISTKNLHKKDLIYLSLGTVCNSKIQVFEKTIQVLAKYLIVKL